MKKIGILVSFLLTGFLALACEVCEKQQPKLLRGISHGAGPESNWDLLIVSVAAVIVLFTFFFSVKWLIFPGEKSMGHIKNIILNSE